MTVQRLLYVAALLSLAQAAQAQTIAGKVLEDGTPNPIAGALIELMRPDGVVVSRAESDSAGGFRVILSVPGRYLVQASHLAYVSAEPAELDVGARELKVIELRLGSAAIPLRPLVVTSERDGRIRGYYERMERSSSGQFITRERIEERPGARTTDLLRELTGLELVRVGSALRGAPVTLVTMRGGLGRCSPTIYIDGLEVGQSPESGVDEFLRPEMLEGVEVYTSAMAAPMPIDARSNCGVVAFWTRPVGEVEKFSWRRVLIGIGAIGTLGTMILLTR